MKGFKQNKQTIQSTYDNWSTTFTSLPQGLGLLTPCYQLLTPSLRSHKLLIGSSFLLLYSRQLVKRTTARLRDLKIMTHRINMESFHNIPYFAQILIHCHC